MELVYLWVEKYKNIENQGFNFSPRFECEYDKETKKLIINEKKEYVSIFPDNSNVTAIVGENGSGKSSLQKLIFKIIYKYYKKENPNDSKCKANLIIENKGILYQLVFNSDLIKHKKLVDFQDKKIDFFSMHFNYMFDTWYDTKEDEWVKNIYHRTDGYTNPLLLEPYKGHKNQFIDIDNLEYLNVLKLLRFFKIIDKKEKLQKITDFFIPKYIAFALKYENEEYKIIEKFNHLDTSIEKDNNIERIIRELYQKKDLLKLNRVYIILKTMEIGNDKNKYFNDRIYEKFQNSFKKHKDFQLVINNQENFCKELLNNTLPKDYYKTNKIEQSLSFESSFTKNILEDLNETIIDCNYSLIDKSAHYIDILPAWLYFDITDGIKSFYSLSSGEKSIFNIILNILYQVKNIITDEKYDTVNIFLDETELGLHPSWQKKYFLTLIDSLSQYKKDMKMNLYFATHSPFLLSDLPKENVIFLEKGKQVYPDIETFGANIHTLLSHGFFMKNGLMGEFAKGKIDEAIKILNQKQLNEEDIKFCENIISIVGEPILKRQMQKMLDSKRLAKVDKIDEIQKQIADLQQELKKIKND